MDKSPQGRPQGVKSSSPDADFDEDMGEIQMGTLKFSSPTRRNSVTFIVSSPLDIKLDVIDQEQKDAHHDEFDEPPEAGEEDKSKRAPEVKRQSVLESLTKVVAEHTLSLKSPSIVRSNSQVENQRWARHRGSLINRLAPMPEVVKEGEIGIGDNVKVRLANGLWVSGQVMAMATGADGAVSYEVDTFANPEYKTCSRNSIILPESEQLFDSFQFRRRPTLANTLQHNFEYAKRGHGFTGLELTLKHLKIHIKPILYCIPFIIFFTILAQYEVLKYEDDGDLLEVGHRRFLGVTLPPCDEVTDEDHTRRYLSGDDIHDTACDPVMIPLPPDAYLVAAVICCAVVFLLMEYPGYIIMVLSALVLTLTHTIEEEDAWHAMGFPTLLACCSVTAVAKGLANTHVMKIIMQGILDFDKGNFVSLTLLFLFTGVVSTVVDNFAVIGIYQYVYNVFGKRTGLDPKVLMMPLSFISMIGGTCTVLASGAMLVAKSFLEEETLLEGDQRDLTMFEMTAAAVPCLVISAPFLAWYSVFLFGKSKDEKKVKNDKDLLDGDEQTLPDVESQNLRGGPPKDGPIEFETDSESESEEHLGHRYIMKYRVGEWCKIAHVNKLENADYLWMEREKLVTKDGKERIVKGLVEIKRFGVGELAEGDVVYVVLPGDKVHDMEHHGFELMELNEFREQKVNIDQNIIAEGIVDPDSKLVGLRYAELSSRLRHWHVIGLYTHDSGGIDSRMLISPKILHEKVKGGDLVLLEGEPEALRQNPEGFIQITPHDSSHHHDIYIFQLIMSLCCLLFVIVCTVIQVLSLMETVLISLVVLVQTGCLTLEEMLHKFKWRVLLLVTGAYAISHAFVNTMLAEYLSQKILQITTNERQLLVIMYILSLILGMAFPPKAEIGILYPICLTLQSRVPDLTMKKIIMVVLQGTAIQLLTPNNPENSLISDGYTFTDFAKLGFPPSIFIGLIFIIILDQTA